MGTGRHNARYRGSRQIRTLRRTAAALAVASCFASGLSQANPTNPTVVSGAAAIQQSGNLLSITNTPSAIINWGSFSIGAGEITRFIQQSQASAVLNRVVGQDPSAILGALQSNGRVFLINPNGILFGAGSQIDVGGLVASTLNLSDADFLAGRMRFSELPNAGSIVNQGSINTGSGGGVYLVAPDITNSGIITSPQGDVVLAAGKSVELVNPGTPNLRVEINAPDNQVLNLGKIVTDSGRVGIYAGLINHSGTIQADSAVVGENGQILLKASKDITLDAGSLTTANGPSGGSIKLQSADTTLVSGTIEAKGTQGKGGSVQVLGNLVGLTGKANIDASGETAGGTVLVGGDYQGKNPDIQNAYRTYFGPDANIKADAATNGDGGRIIVWSDDATRAYGNISARGGNQSGDGGFVEVSGKKWLDFNASVNTTAANGAAGILLLDPSDVTISLAGDVLSGGSFTGGIFAGATSSTTNISWATIGTELVGNNVIITTSGSGGSGNITVADPFAYNSTNSLSLLAHNNITINGAITNSSFFSTATLSMYAGWDGVSTVSPAVTSGTGSIFVNQNLTYNSDILLRAGKDINISASVIDASGSITMTSVGGDINVINSQLKNDNDPNVSLTANSGTITVNNSLITSTDTDASINLSAANISVVNSNGLTGGIRADAVESTSSVTLTATNNITVDNSAITATGGSSNVTVTLNAGSQLNVSNNSTIAAIDAPSFAAVNLSAGSIVVSNSTVSATGGGGSGAGATVVLSATNGISANTSNIFATGGNRNFSTGDGGPASVTLTAANGININSSSISATGGDGSGTGAAGGAASLNLTGGTSVALAGVGATVTATGGAPDFGGLQGVATIDISATLGAITNAGGLLDVQSGTAGSSITLTARDGIGTQADPIRIDNDAIELFATNTSSGDVALSTATGNYFLSSLSNILNSNPTGTYFVQSENSDVTLAGAFTPGAAPLQAGQSVVLSAPLGNVVIDSTGSVATGASFTANAVNVTQNTGGTISVPVSATASGSITLQQAASYTLGLLQAGTAISVNSTAGAIIDGNGGLNNVFAPSASLTALSGIGSVVAPLQSQVINLTLGSTGGVGEIGVNNTGNVILSSFNGTGALVTATGTLSVGSVTTNNGNANLQAGGNLSVDAGSGINAGTGTVTLTSTGGAIIDNHAGLDVVAATGTLVAATGIASVAAPLQTQISNLSLSSTGGVGEIGVNNTGNVALSSFNGTGVLVTATGTMNLGSVTTNNGNASVQAGGNLSLDAGGGINAGSGTVSLTSTGGAIVDNHAGMDIVAGSATLTTATGVSSVAAPLQTQVASLTASATSGEIGILNTGNLALTLAGFGGSNAKFTTSGLLSTLGGALAITGDLSLIGNGINIGQGLTGIGNLLLDAGAGNLGITGASVNGVNVTLTGSNIDIGTVAAIAPTAVSASNALTINASNNLTVQGGAVGGASAVADSGTGNTTVTVGADVNVRGGSGPAAFASLIGGPDMFMTAGGAVRMDAGTGAGAYAQIASLSPASIQLTFPTLATGGYFVNGVENVVYDALSLSGFLASGLPAVFGSNLLVSYGVVFPPLLLPPIITTTNNPVDPYLHGGYPIDPLLPFEQVDGEGREMICR